MSGDFGHEFRNLERLFTSDSGSFPHPFPVNRTLDVGTYFDIIRDEARALGHSAAAIAPPQGIIFYIPPGRFRLPGHPVPAPGMRRVYELPENVELYIANGALLRLDVDADLVIRGSLRAGPYQIFGYSRSEPHARDVLGLNTVPLGRVILATRRVSAVLPEWWGAQAVLGGVGPEGTRGHVRGNDSSDALRAAFQAACGSTRDYPEPDGTVGSPRPALPVLLGGPYNTFQTIRIDAPSGPDGRQCCLVLRGRVGRTSTGYGRPSIARRILPAGAPLATEFVEPQDEQALLRLGPGVHFEFEDVSFALDDGEGRAGGCIDVVCDASESSTRRGLIRWCTILGGTRYALRLRAPDDTRLRHVVVDTTRLTPGMLTGLSERGIDVETGSGTMLHVDGGLLGHAPLAFDARNPIPPPSDAVIHVRGGSVLVRGTQFDNGTGPRPSRGDVADLVSLRLGRPDGQSIFLAPSATANHLTVLHVEDQGWWFLSRPKRGEDHVVLINVAHNNTHWFDDASNLGRYTRITGRKVLPASPSAPPSVVWLGAGGRCVLIGNRFDWTMLTDSEGVDRIVDVATVFARFGPVPGHHIRLAGSPGAIIGPPTYERHDDFSAVDFDIPHLVPYSVV